jgi:hypothetical protein
LAVIAIILVGVKAKWIFNSQIILAISTAGLFIVTAFLVAITCVYASHTRKMAEAMHQSNRINYRPYLLIEELRPEVVKDLMQTEQIFHRKFLTFLNPHTREETFYYSLKNVGNVPAHNVEFNYEVYELDQDTTAPSRIDVPHKKDPSISLFPDQDVTKIFNLGKTVMFRNDFANKKIQLRVYITYDGVRDMDTNKYYTEMVLTLTPTQSPDMPQPMPYLEKMDEGIEKQ